jgi:hypothetical protein
MVLLCACLRCMRACACVLSACIVLAAIHMITSMRGCSLVMSQYGHYDHYTSLCVYMRGYAQFVPSGGQRGVVMWCVGLEV